MLGVNHLILREYATINGRHWTYRGGYDAARSNHWIDAVRSKLVSRRSAHKHDAFALVIVSSSGGPNDAYVIPFSRLAPIFGRTPPNGRNSGTWRAHVVHGRFYFAQPDEVDVSDCHGSHPKARRIVEATLRHNEVAVLEALADLAGVDPQ